MKQILLTILAVICLSICCLSSGIMLCINVPQITENLTRATALTDTAKFSRDQLVVAADQTRGYVAGTTTKEELYNTIKQINQDAQTQYKDKEGNDFRAIPDAYTIDSTALAHLDDVKTLFANIKIAFWICAVGALLFCILLGLLCGRNVLGKSFIWSGALILAAIVLLIVWAVIDFNGMFNWLHSIFFKSGSWFFSEKSLLISMYPTAFWAGMGVICTLSSAILSIIYIIAGKIIK